MTRMMIVRSRIPKEVLSIHYLRGIAALLVVFHHSIIQFAPLRADYGHLEFGQGGVDIFFVISGFVIYLSSVRGGFGPVDFLKRRIVRIVPLYWVATLVLVAVALSAAHLMVTTAVTPQAVLQSLLFIPAYSAAFPDEIWPVLVPGWSLNHEMFFYAVFAVGLLVARARLFGFLVATIGLLVLIGLILDPQIAPLRTYTDMRLLEFLFGVFLARHSMQGGFGGTLPIAIFLPLGFALLAVSPFVPLPHLVKMEPWAIPAMMIVSGALALEARLSLASSALLKLMGNASYSLYLSHLFTLGVLRIVWVKIGVPLDTVGWALLWFVTALGVSAAASVVVYEWIEKPLTAGARSLLEGPRTYVPKLVQKSAVGRKVERRGENAQ